MNSVQTTIPRERESKAVAVVPISVKHSLPVGLVVLAVLAGCPATAEDVRPPADSFYFPTSLVTSPDEKDLLVINGNSDLRFAAGSIVAVDLDEVDAIASAWSESGLVPDRDCEVDATISYTLTCDEVEVTRPEASVRLGNFAADAKVQTLANGKYRVFVAVRGDPSLTYVDYDPSTQRLQCGGSGDHPECDEDHRLIRMLDDPELPRLIEEPFGVYVDGGNEFALVTHLTSGTVTLVDAPSDGSSPVLSDVLTGIFASDPRTGVRGAVGAAGRLPGTEGDQVYVTSRSEARIQTLSVTRPSPDGLPRIALGNFFFLDKVLPSDDSRSIVFSGDGQRAYIVNRDPPLLHVIDTSVDSTGTPRNQFVGGVELCPEASNLTLVDVAGRGERIYVACFRDGQVWAIDPAGAVVEAVIDVGRGPNVLVGAPSRNKLYVANFLEDTVSVIDIEPGSVTENRAILRLGRTRQSEESQ